MVYENHYPKETMDPAVELIFTDLHRWETVKMESGAYRMQAPGVQEHRPVCVVCRVACEHMAEAPPMYVP
jgi:hypothetical protein